MTIAQISATASQLEILQKINETITVSSEVKENYVSKSGATFTGTVTAPTFSGNLTGTATKATQDGNGNVIANTYLPLSGGTMTGDITIANGAYIKNAVNTGWTRVFGGSAFEQGGRIQLAGKDCSGYEGQVWIVPNDGTNAPALKLFPNGTLTWNGKNVLTEASNNPVGTVIAMAANSAPSGYLLCSGAEVSRITYSALFAKIGTTYGGGNGSTTFNLPNLTDRVIQGNIAAGAYLNAGLPNITGSFGGIRDVGTYPEGAFFDDGRKSNGSPSGAQSRIINFSASRSSGIYGASNTVQPPALTMRYYIKY